MSAPTAVSTLDVERLALWLETHLSGFRGPIIPKKFGDGQSNPTFLLQAASGNYVLRRKPPGVLLKSAHAVDREFRVISALAGSGVPVPQALVLCEDDDVIGSAFYVMEHVVGRILWDPSLPEFTASDRARVYDSMNIALARLHTTDPEKVGLSDFGRPGSYFARQLKRWSDQYYASKTEEIPHMEELMRWLEAHVPADDGRVAIVHGDYRLDNMIFHPSEPRILAVIDWELSTLGHPFADVAYQCMQLRMPHDGVFSGLGGVDRVKLGIPSEADYLAAYCERAKITNPPDWSFCLAFNFFRLAAIVQGVKKRAMDGNGSNPERGLALGAGIPGMVVMAAEIAQLR